MPVETDARRILAELEKVLASTVFANTSRSGRLLRFLVQETVSGTGGLKESVIAVEVLGRHPGFDPRTDPIARVEVSRLRSRLELFYASEGRNAQVRIVLPKGSYVPAFESVAPDVSAQPQADQASHSSSIKIWGAAAVAAVAFLLGVWTGSILNSSKMSADSV